jgi:hypothetical protein
MAGPSPIATRDALIALGELVYGILRLRLGTDIDIGGR